MNNRVAQMLYRSIKEDNPEDQSWFEEAAFDACGDECLDFVIRDAVRAIVVQAENRRALSTLPAELRKATGNHGEETPASRVARELYRSIRQGDSLDDEWWSIVGTLASQNYYMGTLIWQATKQVVEQVEG